MWKHSDVNEKIEVGDCVIINYEEGVPSSFRHKVGHVRSIRDGAAAVEFTQKVSSAGDCDGLCLPGYGYWLPVRSCHKMHLVSKLLRCYGGVIPENVNPSDMVKL